MQPRALTIAAPAHRCYWIPRAVAVDTHQLHSKTAARSLDQAQWGVYWMYNGWQRLYDRLTQELPSWTRPYLNDPSRSVKAQVADAHVLIPTMCVVSAELMDAAPNLELILQPARGISNIDLEAAQQRGIAVCNSPGVNAATTAEGAIMLMMMLARRVHEQEDAFRRGFVGDSPDMGNIMQLCGHTLGIIGMGANGKIVARVAEAMGMHVIGLHSRSSRQELHSMLQQADVVSVHCPLTPQTHHLLGEREFKLMKKGALLVNVARAAVVNKQALTDALSSGHLGGAGLDPHWEEPADPTELLYQLPNVIATPHTGATSTAVYDDMAVLMANNIRRKHDGLKLLHRLV